MTEFKVNRDSYNALLILLPMALELAQEVAMKGEADEEELMRLEGLLFACDKLTID